MFKETYLNTKLCFYMSGCAFFFEICKQFIYRAHLCSCTTFYTCMKVKKGLFTNYSTHLLACTFYSHVSHIEQGKKLPDIKLCQILIPTISFKLTQSFKLIKCIESISHFYFCLLLKLKKIYMTVYDIYFGKVKTQKNFKARNTGSLLKLLPCD